MSFPPPPQPADRDLAELMDMLAYILATADATSGISWILGDVGMGAPKGLPFGYISQFQESVKWMTARGGVGGLPAPGPEGLDDWDIPIVITACYAPHDYAAPQRATPPASSALYPSSLGLQSLPYYEQPGWRQSQQVTQRIKGVLRTNIVLAGEAATTRITESRYVLQVVQGRTYRAARITVQAQQRRTRGT